MERPNIFEYDNYRKFLSSWYNWMKETNPLFSFRTFSSWAGFRSPNHLQLVMQGKRNITKETLQSFIKALKLKYREQKFFEILVNFNQAESGEAKARYLMEISLYLKKLGEQLKHGQFEYLTKWYYPVVRELVTTKDFKEDRHYIAKKIGHGINPRHVDEAIEKLLELGLLKRDASGKLVQSDAIITTGTESTESAVYFYHDQMIKLAHNALMKQLPNERNISAVTLSCSKNDISEIASILSDCRKQVLHYLENRKEKTNDEDVYQLNLQLFRVSTR